MTNVESTCNVEDRAAALRKELVTIDQREKGRKKKANMEGARSSAFLWPRKCTMIKRIVVLPGPRIEDTERPP